MKQNITFLKLRVIKFAFIFALCFSFLNVLYAAPSGNRPTACTFSGALLAGDLTMTSRLSRPGSPTGSCASAYTTPATIAGGPFFYDTYTVSNTTGVAQCATFTLTTTDLVNANIQFAVYTNSFNPANLVTNYLADPGTSSGTPAAPAGISASVTVPAGANLVLVVYSTNANTGASGTASAYTLNINNLNCAPPPPCTGTPAPGATNSTVNSACATIPFTLSPANATAGTGVTYQWQSSSTGIAGSFTSIPLATNSTYTTSLTASTYYQVVVTCGGNSGTSTPTLVTLTPANQCYCIPGVTNCNANDMITNVTIGGINNNSLCSTGPPAGYGNFTALTPGVLLRGAANPSSVTVSNGGTEYLGVWVDYNQDGIFQATEFQALGTGPGGTFTTPINVPATALLGNTRMRVRVRFAQALTGIDACVGYIYGETEDYTVTIQPCVPVAITAGSPANTSTACGGNATFTAAATGSIPSYQWEYRVDANSFWLLVPNTPPYSGVNTATLTITNVPISLNGYQYRAIVSGACTGPDFTGNATLTVTPYIPAIFPTPAVLCAGSSLQLFASPPPTTTTVASASNLNIHIPDGSDIPAPSPAVRAAGINHSITIAGIPAGAVVTNISVKVNVPHTYVADLMLVVKAPNGKILNLSNLIGGQNNPGVNFTNTNFTGAAGAPALITGTSPGYTGTFRPDAAGPVGAFGIPSGPTGYIPNVNNFAGLGQGGPGSAVNGTWTIAMFDAGPPDAGDLKDWSVSITWGVTPATAIFSPNTNLFLDAALTQPYNGTAVNSVYTNTPTSTTYTAVVSTATCTATVSIPVSVNTPAGGTPTLSNTSICVGSNGFIKLGGNLTGGPGFVHNFQEKAPGATAFTNITAGAVYSTNGDTLKFTNVPLSLNGYQYRDSVSTGANCGSVISSVATLSVNPIPVVTIGGSPRRNLFPGLTTTLNATVTGVTPPVTYQWFRNGVAVPGATNNTLVVSIDGRGTYTVVATAQGCSSTAATTTNSPIVIGDSVGVNTLFIYPSPNTGKFQVRYFFNTSSSTQLPAMVNVYDQKGARIFTKRYIVAGYQAMNVDLSAHGKGIYRVELTADNGDRIKTGSVMVF